MRYLLYKSCYSNPESTKRLQRRAKIRDKMYQVTDLEPQLCPTKSGLVIITCKTGPAVKFKYYSPGLLNAVYSFPGTKSSPRWTHVHLSDLLCKLSGVRQQDGLLIWQVVLAGFAQRGLLNKSIFCLVTARCQFKRLVSDQFQIRGWDSHQIWLCLWIPRVHTLSSSQ